MIDRSRWPYIQAYGEFMGFSQNHIIEEYLKADESNAPADAYASRFLSGWFRLSEYPRRARINLHHELEDRTRIKLSDLLKENDRADQDQQDQRSSG
jgi:hypothetical protein